MGIVERGLDSFRIGQLVNLSFPGMIDENFYSEEEYPSKEDRKTRVNKDMNSAGTVPAVILTKNKEDDGWPTYDVGFLTRTRSGGMSGMLVLSHLCVWRYLRGDEVEEGTPPNWLLEGIGGYEIDENYFDNINNSEICYIAKGPMEDGSSDYWIYPFGIKEVKNG